MSETQPVPHGRAARTPPGAAEALNPFEDDEPTGRQSARRPARHPARMYTPPEPHEKYELWEEEKPPGMDWMWLPTSVAGAPNSRIVGQCFRAGWQPAKSIDFPRISGHGVEYPPEMIAAGLLQNVSDDAPIVIDEQMLVLRPAELSRKYEAQAKRNASDQVDNQMRRLRQASRGFRGTELKRGQHAPLPDSARYETEDDE